MVTTEANAMDITEDEVALYDRQIRLWGIDSQRKLRNARVLISGIGGLGAEVAKNIILAGVKSVTLMDDNNVSIDDSSSQFLAPTDAIGQNRAVASVKRAQALNPMVKVTAVAEDVSGKPDKFFEDFDLVVVTCCPLKQLIRLNNICRQLKVKFYCGDVFGMFGYFFSDLLDHSYVEGTGDTATMHNLTFIPLEDTLALDWSLSENVKRLRKMDPSYFLLLTLHKFISDEGRVPDRLQKDEDIAKLKKLSLDTLKSNSVQQDLITDSLLSQLFGVVSPVAAILGGVLAQDIIKCVSNKDKPGHNYFFFNPDRCCGFFEYIAPVKVD